MARGPALTLLLPCLALAQPLPEAYLRAAEHFRAPRSISACRRSCCGPSHRPKAART